MLYYQNEEIKEEWYKKSEEEMQGTPSRKQTSYWKDAAEKCGSNIDLKEHEGEKKAIFIASKLNGVAFDVHGRLSADEKKDPEKIKGDLLKEFSCEERNREAALHSLMTSIRIKDESAQAFAYKILRLVQLAYATLGEATRKTIAKDYFVKGLSTNLQVALKFSTTFAQMDINAVADETTRLEIAGINPFNPERKECVSVVETCIERRNNGII